MWASILSVLHAEGCRVIGSQCLGLRCFHHDVLWQHNYALYLALHGSPNHISCSLESSIPAATVELRERAEGRGGREDGEEEGGEARSLKLSKWNAKAVDWRPDAEGAEQGCRRSASGLSLCINVRLRALARRAGSKAPRGKGGKRVWGAREESVNPEASAATVLHITRRPFLGTWNIIKVDGEISLRERGLGLR